MVFLQEQPLLQPLQQQQRQPPKLQFKRPQEPQYCQKNDNSTTKTTPIKLEVTKTDVKKLQSDERYISLEAVLDKEGVKFHKYGLNKTTGIAKLKRNKYTPSCLRIVYTIKLEYHKDTESLPDICVNLAKWKDQLKHYKE